MDKEKIINETAEYVKTKLLGESSGHDWWHIYRVRNLAMEIAKKEKADLFIVELAALLHDIADWKFNGGDIGESSRIAEEWLKKMAVEENIISQIGEIIGSLSFKGAGVETKMKTQEGMIVQDADRLDAMGAIGIGRTFAYGGNRGHEMYNPNIRPEAHETFEQYKSKKSPTINHFYEKMLLLKGLMNTKTAKTMAKRRHKFMEEFLKEFLGEWEGNF